MLHWSVNVALIYAIAHFNISSPVHGFRMPTQRNTASTYNCHRTSSWRNMAKDEYQSMEVDESKLSPSEVERLAFIRKLTMEADEIIKAAGLSLEDEELDEEVVQRPIKDTLWSGQSNVEESVRSKSNLQDVVNRKGLAVGDSVALIVSAAVGRSYIGESVDIISTLAISVPFIASWLLVSPFLGSFTREATSSKGNVPRGLVLGWTIAIPVAIVLSESFKVVKTPVETLIFTQISVFACLGIWRLIYILLIGETSENEYKSAGFFEVFKMIKSLVKRW